MKIIDTREMDLIEAINQGNEYRALEYTREGISDTAAGIDDETFERFAAEAKTNGAVCVIRRPYGVSSYTPTR